MDSDEGKLFVGGIPWDTTEEKLNDYFSKYGDVTQTVIMRDKTTGRPRGFGFVVYSDPSVLDRVLQDKHIIDDKVVEAKRALSREEQYSTSRTGNHNVSRTAGEGENIRTKKIFVGGLPPTLSEDGFREYFETFGPVTDVVIMYDQTTQRPRGFGFISFDTEDAVDRVCYKSFHELSGKLVEVKRALPKDSNSGGGGGSGSGGSGTRGGSYQSYGSSGASAGAYDSRMDGSKFMQSQTTAGGFPSYPGYSAPGYGYGAANSGVGYGGYGGYGVSGYGGASAGFGSGIYGNPNVPSPGYAGNQPGMLRSNQTPGYGGSGYGAAPTWNVSGGGVAVSAPIGQSPGGASGYGSQSYGNYGGNDGSYFGGYGAGGRSGSGPTSHVNGGASGGEQGAAGGYLGSAYGDANGSSGYTGAGSYGSTQARQNQQ